MSETVWPTEWLRGVLEVCILRILADGPSYGYAIANSLAAAGLGTVKGGTLYPILGRLEAARLVTTHWMAGDGGPGRKFYELSATGRGDLAARSRQWQSFADLTTHLLAPDTALACEGERQ